MTATGQLSHKVFPGLYRDSVALMSLAREIEGMDGVIRVGAMMATPANQTILARSDMLPDGVAAAPDDLIIAVRADTGEHASSALEAAATGLTSVDETGARREETRPATIDEALAVFDAQLVTVSTPGAYAPMVIERALRRGLHVFCFSDNVPVADERRLKEMAVAARLLMMGPDCGTAIIDGQPLGFANVVERGSVGVVAASGTGAQEVACLLDRAGVGISHIIGVGGHDLSRDVGGLMTHLALDMLQDDPATGTILVVSKPPSPDVAASLLDRLASSRTPVVACLLGLDDAEAPVPVRGTLEGAAIAVAERAGQQVPIGDEMPTRFAGAASGSPSKVLGLYTGGTLASEAAVVLGRAGVDAEIVDLGDDEYTRGRPHPMIDPSARAEKVAAVGADAQIGVLVVDCVLGHGACADPATPLAVAAATAIARARAEGRALHVFGSVTGTGRDPQGLERQQAILADVGIVVFPSNAAAARAAAQYVTGGTK